MSDRNIAIDEERRREARILGKDYWEIRLPEIYEERDRNLYDDISEYFGYETENTRQIRLRKERDRYKSIVDDIKTFGSLRPKTIEDIRDLK